MPRHVHTRGGVQTRGGSAAVVGVRTRATAQTQPAVQTRSSPLKRSPIPRQGPKTRGNPRGREGPRFRGGLQPHTNISAPTLATTSFEHGSGAGPRSVTPSPSLSIPSARVTSGPSPPTPSACVTAGASLPPTSAPFARPRTRFTAQPAPPAISAQPRIATPASVQAPTAPSLRPRSVTHTTSQPSPRVQPSPQPSEHGEAVDNCEEEEQSYGAYEEDEQGDGGQSNQEQGDDEHMEEEQDECVDEEQDDAEQKEQDDVEQEEQDDEEEEQQDDGVDEAEDDGVEEEKADAEDPKRLFGVPMTDVGKPIHDIDPRPAAFSRMKKIVHGHFYGVWKSVSEVDKETRKMWFEEFQVLGTNQWNVPTDWVRKAFFSPAGKHLRKTFKARRKSGTVPSFLSMEQWAAIEEKRKTNPYCVKRAEINKRNRGSENAVNAGVYRGGSHNMRTWVKKMKGANGTEPKICDVIGKLWSGEDGVITGSRTSSYVECERLAEDESSTALSSMELWIKPCKADQSGKVFGLGEEGTAAMVSCGKSSGIFEYNLHQHGLIITQLQEMKTTQAKTEAELKDAKTTMQTFMQDQRKMLQLLLDHSGVDQGITSSLPNSPLPNNRSS